MARLAKQFDGGFVGLMVDATTLERLERIAPSAFGKRSEFVRQAIVRELDRCEQEERASSSRVDAA